MDLDDIMESYRQGDDQQRMNLFLAFRDLRAAFRAIDEELEAETRS